MISPWRTVGTTTPDTLGTPWKHREAQSAMIRTTLYGRVIRSRNTIETGTGVARGVAFRLRCSALEFSRHSRHSRQNFNIFIFLRRSKLKSLWEKRPPRLTGEKINLKGRRKPSYATLQHSNLRAYPTVPLTVTIQPTGDVPPCVKRAI